MISDRLLRSALGPRRSLALGGDLIRGLAWLGAARVIFGSATIALPASWRLARNIHFNDFGRFYYATQLFQQGRDMYVPTPATPVRMPPEGIVQLLDLNPPHLHWLLIPLTGLPLETAFVVWSLAGLVCLLASLALVQLELRAGWTPAGLMWTLLWIVSSAASATTFVTGQLTYFVMLPVTLAWLAARRGTWTRAAILLGVLTSVKLFFGVFGLYFLVTRRWRACAWMAGASAATFTAGVAFFGAAAYASWAHALSSVVWPWLTMNASVSGLFSRTLDGGPVFAPLLFVPGAVRVATLGASLALLVLTLRKVMLDAGPGAADRSFLRVLLVAILISPLGWVYYLWIVAGPAIAVWLSSRDRASRLTTWLVLVAIPGLFVPIGLTLQWADQPWSSATIGSIYMWSTLALWTAAAATAPEQSPSARGEAPVRHRDRESTA